MPGFAAEIIFLVLSGAVNLPLIPLLALEVQENGHGLATRPCPPRMKHSRNKRAM
jgi:hypothetical protein